MTGWDEHGFAVKTGSVLDSYLGRGDLQDAENCGYAPTSVLAELNIDAAYGTPEFQFREGRIWLADGALLERGGTLNCVWAVTRLPHPQRDPGALMEEPDLHPKTRDPEDERRADDAHMAAGEAWMEHAAEQGEGGTR
jgi:hypothetical protein